MKRIFLIFMLIYFPLLTDNNGPNHILSINTNSLYPDPKIKTSRLCIIPPMKKEIKNIRVEADLLTFANNSEIGIFIGDHEENLLKIHQGWRGAEGFYLVWTERPHRLYEFYIIGEKVMDEQGNKGPYLLAKWEGGRYPIQFHKYIIEIIDSKVTAFVNGEKIYEGLYKYRPQNLKVAFCFFIVEDYPAGIDNLKIYEVSQGKRILLYKNDFEGENDFNFWESSIGSAEKILKIIETPMNFLGGIKKPLGKIIGKGWYGFGVPGYQLEWVTNNIIFTCPGEGEIQITDISEIKRPKVLSHIWVGFLAGYNKLEDRKYLLGPRGTDFLLNLEDFKNPILTPIEYQWTREQLSTLIFPVDFRSFIIPKSKKWIATVSPYSDTIICFWDISEDITKPKFLSSYQNSEMRSWFGFFWEKENIILLSAIKEGKDNVAFIDVKDITNTQLIGYLGENLKLGPFLDETHLVILTPNKDRKDFRYPVIEIWEINRKIEKCRKISSYEIKQEYPPLIGSLTWDEEKRELIFVLCYQLGTQDSVFKKREGNRREGSSLILGLKVTEDWNMEEIYKIPSWGISRFKDIKLSPDKKHIAVSDYNYGVWILKRDNSKFWIKEVGFPVPSEGHWACWDIKKNCVYVFPTFGSQMRVFDVEDVANPKEISNLWLETWVNAQPCVIGNFIVVPQVEQITIIDIKDPINPKIVETWDYSGYLLPLPERNILFISYGVSPSWGKWRMYVKMKKLENGKFIDIGNELIVRDEETKGAPFAPRLQVEGNRLYVNDIGADIFSVYEFTEDGKFSKIGEISIKDFITSRGFNMDYPGRFAIKNKKVYFPALGGTRPNTPVIYVIDTSVVPFRKIFSYESKVGTYLMDIKIYKDNLLLLDYGGKIHVFKIVRNGEKIYPDNEFHIQENSWSLGDIKDDILICPGLSNLVLVELSE